MSTDTQYLNSTARPAAATFNSCCILSFINYSDVEENSISASRDQATQKSIENFDIVLNNESRTI